MSIIYRSVSASSGLIVISLPKSGTMFLSRYLASLSGFNYRFGLLTHMKHPDAVEKALHPPDPMIREKSLDTPGFVGEYMAKYRESIYPMQTRGNMDFGDWIIADHGFDEISVFTRNPEAVKIIPPLHIAGEAKRRGMGLIYLYRRDIRDVINSLAHFLSSGWTKFLQFKSYHDALQFCIDRHAPVLARQVRTWRDEFDGMKVTYEALYHHTRKTITQICDTFHLPYKNNEIITSMKDFITCNFRNGGIGDHKFHLSPAQNEHITRQYPDLCLKG